MLLYLVLTVLLSVLTFVSLVLIVVGLVKKKRSLWVGSLTAFVIGSVLTAACAFLYVRETFRYVASNEFQHDTQHVAEHIGETVGSAVSGTAEGLEATLDDEALAQLANKGAKIVGKGVKAVATGLDETTGKTTVFTDESVEKAGITLGRAEQISTDVKNSFGLFLAFENDFSGKLVLTAYDSKGLKQDTSELTIQETAGKAKVYVFPFEYFQPSLSGYCILTQSK